VGWQSDRSISKDNHWNPAPSELIFHADVSGRRLVDRNGGDAGGTGGPANDPQTTGARVGCGLQRDVVLAGVMM
jgi:hypothetical protein